ncbi:hypothetical protein KKD19_03780 [Patescibacteria group bacterium]|nr:hypothetical protein [Patescibacteria group bacterium]
MFFSTTSLLTAKIASYEQGITTNYLKNGSFLFTDYFGMLFWKATEKETIN